jgi:Rab-GTPase-TBC domain
MIKLLKKEAPTKKHEGRVSILHPNGAIGIKSMSSYDSQQSSNHKNAKQQLSGDKHLITLKKPNGANEFSIAFKGMDNIKDAKSTKCDESKRYNDIRVKNTHKISVKLQTLNNSHNAIISPNSSLFKKNFQANSSQNTVKKNYLKSICDIEDEKNDIRNVPLFTLTKNCFMHGAMLEKVVETKRNKATKSQQSMMSRNYRKIRTLASPKGKLSNPKWKVLFHCSTLFDCVGKYLSYKDFIHLSLSCREFYFPKSIKQKLYQTLCKGLTDTQRVRYWKKICKLDKKPTFDYKKQCNNPSPFYSDIEKDVGRTFTVNEKKQMSSRISQLQRVLNAFSWKNPDIGYTQGINFIAAILCKILPNEEVYRISRMHLQLLII